MIRTADTALPIQFEPMGASSWSEQQRRAEKAEQRRLAVELFVTKTQVAVKPRGMVLAEYVIGGLSLATAGYLCFLG